MHQIRLHGPWEVVGPDETPRTVTMPQEWRSLFGETAGVARFSRWFHCPTNLDAEECVRVSFAGLGGIGRIALNGITLQEVTAIDSSLRVEITAALQPRNRLEVELRFDPAVSSSPGGLFGDIAIQIEAA